MSVGSFKSEDIEDVYKRQLSDSLCAMEQFENPKTYCTKPGDKHRYLTLSLIHRDVYKRQAQSLSRRFPFPFCPLLSIPA